MTRVIPTGPDLIDLRDRQMGEVAAYPARSSNKAIWSAHTDYDEEARTIHFQFGASRLPQRIGMVI